MRTTKNSIRSSSSSNTARRTTSDQKNSTGSRASLEASNQKTASSAKGIPAGKTIPSTRGIPAGKTVPGTRALKSVSDKALLSGIRKLSERERETVLSILVYLVEIDRRRLYLEMGYCSLYKFCVKSLGYCEATAARRVSVARCIGKFPVAGRALSSGRVSMTNLARVTKLFTSENARELLSRISGASKREVELLVSRYSPKSAIRERVTPVYVKAVLKVAGDESDKKFTITGDGKNPASSTGSRKSRGISTCCGDGSGEGPAASPETGGRPFAGQAFVLEERLKITFGADPEFIGKVDRIRSLLSSKHHRHLELSELFSIVMDEYIERHSPEGRLRRREQRDQRKTEKGSKKTAKPDTEPVTASKKDQKKEISRHIPRKVRDKVYARDKGQCSYVSAGGRRCGSTRDLQIDHIVPFARGGDDSPSNLRLLCGRHNRLEAERAYGKKHMQQYLKETMEQYCIKKMEHRVREHKVQYHLRCFQNLLKNPAADFRSQQPGFLSQDFESRFRIKISNRDSKRGFG